MRQNEIAESRFWLASRMYATNPNLMITFIFNPPQGCVSEATGRISAGWDLQPDTARKKMTLFFNMLMGLVHHRGWYRNHELERPEVIGFLENPKTNLHYHTLAKLDDDLFSALNNCGKSQWFGLCPGGQLDFRSVHDLEGAVRYVLADQFTPDAINEVYYYGNKGRFGNISGGSLENWKAYRRFLGKESDGSSV